MHGLIFFYIQKFADLLSKQGRMTSAMPSMASLTSTNYLPSKSYPDEQAVSLLSRVAEASGETLPGLLEEFGIFLAPHLIKVAGHHVDPSWRTLDLIEHTESVIHTMVRATTPDATPPVIQTFRVADDELQVIYTSSRQLCRLASGIIRGVAAHYDEPIELTEDGCMRDGSPFCTFVARILHQETHDSNVSHAETMQLESSADGSLSISADELVVTGRVFDDPVPTMIGGHRVIRLLGRGGMGRVYLGHDDSLDRDVAIKTMLPCKADDPSARQRFLRESRVAAQVEHENVVTIYQVGEHPMPGLAHGLPYFVMQRLSGGSLASARLEVGRLPLREALRVARETAAGLHAAHAKGLIHRDIKPENIFLEGPGKRVKIIDFGLASTQGTDDVRLTVDGAIVGTPAYMAPERVLNAKEVDSKADIFGLGVILYEMLAGQFPFEGTSILTMLTAISRGDPKPLTQCAPDVPEDVAQLVMRMIAREKENRPESCEAIAKEIAAIETRLISDS